VEPEKTVEDNKTETPFPIVGIGASAGGLHSLECFLEALPKGFDFAVVFIQHLSPAHKSLMPEILRSKWRNHEFIEIEDGLHLLPGKLYLCPPAIEVRIHEGAFRVNARPKEHIHFPIDEFLISLAEDSAERAIAVIFSGAGTDGVRGIQAVRTDGGTVFVQDPATAQFPELPHAAIKTGQVDSVLPPPDIAREIVRLFGSGELTDAPDKIIDPAELEPFFLLIREKTGHHFNHYKKSVVSRRIKRRMSLQGISSITEYIKVVADKPGEALLLASDLMIGVTSFFRDRLAWKALSIGVIRKLIVEDGDAPIRVWTPACATGEESYSIAMMLSHELDLTGKKRELQVFATDVNDASLEKAREGKYTASIAADIPADYLSDFFTYTDDGRALTVSKELRQHVIFAKQDILTDPPFSRLDLVICRNLLIYLEPDAQEKCITLFHYALRPGGYLFLGNAESPGRKSTLFKSLAHKKCRVYEKIDMETSSRLPLTMPFATERAARPSGQQPALDQRQSIIQLSQETLLERYAPAAVTIDQNYNILYNNGSTKRYLTQPRGAPTHNLLELIPENLRSKIRGAIYKVTKEASPISIRAGIAGDDGQKKQVLILVSKMKDNLFLIDFREKEGSPSEALPESSEIVCPEEPAVRQLEIELSATRQELQTNIEQLKSLNEEQQSSNEELQAANEELETSREELQSLNEELITVNAQLQSKVEEQEETNNDLNNFLGSTNIPTIFLDHRFRVKRYTAAITKLIKLIPSDVGRQIIDMSQELLGPDLIVDAQSVLENLAPVRKEIRINGTWYVRTALPYRTLDDRIEGVVVTYGDVTELKRAEENAVRAKEEWERTFASVPDLIAILDNQHRVLRVNEAMAGRLGKKPEDCIGLHCYEAVHGLSAPPPFCPHLRTIEDGREHIEEVHEDRLGGDFLVTTTPLLGEKGERIGSVHIAHDTTGRKLAESERETAVEFLRLVNESRNTMQLVHAATAFYRERAGCEAVGIRLRQEHDYPYYETHGFPAEFVRAENRLCACDKDGRPILDSAGNPVLDCMCGNVICGRFDPSKPFFTKRGNFWSNNTTALLASTTEKDRQARTRNRCNGEGYESVALIGLTLGDERLGLLQLNDRRKDRFTPDSIALWERLADYLAVALAKFRTDEELQKSEEQFRTLADSIPNLAWWANGDGYITWYNRRWYEYTGTTPEQMAGWGWQSVHDPEVLPKVMERWKASIATGEPFDMEFPLHGADGVFRPFLTRVLPLKDSAGLVLRWFGTNTDISTVKQAEKMMAHMAAVVQSADDAIISKDLNGIVQTWNVGAEMIFGYTAEEMIGRDISALSPTGHTDDVSDILKRISLGEHIEHFETVRMRKDGTIIPVLLTFSPIKDASGKIVGASKIAHDVTERKRAEEALRQSEERYRTLFTTLMEGFCIIEMFFDTEGRPVDYRFLEINPAFEAQTGLQNAQGRLMRELAPDHEAHWFEIYGEIALTGEPMHFVNEARALNRWYDVYAYRVGRPEDRQVAIIFNDITAHKRDEEAINKLNDELLAKNEQLEFSNKELESFIYSVSHDLRGPLRHISGFAELLMRDIADKLDEKGKRYLSRIHDGSVKMSRLIDDLLNLSRISRQEIQRTVVNMSEMATSIVADLREARPDRSVYVNIKVDLTSFADGGLIEVALSNLLRNAWKFTAKTENPSIEFGTIEKDNKIIYYIRDNGAGFDQKYAGKMFWPFHRLHSEASFEGTGIGLAIVERIIRLHGGKVWAEGLEGKGATIYFSLN